MKLPKIIRGLKTGCSKLQRPEMKDWQKIMQMLRKNSRTKISEISKATGLPRTAIDMKLKCIKDSCIKRFVTLIDFRKIGYKERVIFLLKTWETELPDMSPVNNMTKIRGNYSIIIDCYFRNNEDALSYLESLEKYHPRAHYIVEEIACEEFLAR